MLEKGSVVIDFHINGNRTKTAQTSQFIEIYFGAGGNSAYKANYILPSSIYAINQNSTARLNIDKFSKGHVYQEFHFSKTSEKTYSVNESLDFSFVPKVKPTEETIYVGLGSQLLFASPIVTQQQFISPNGLAAPNYSTSHNIYNQTKVITPLGYSAGSYGYSTIHLATLYPSAISSKLAFGLPVIYNALQIVKANGFYSYGVGAPYLLGGVKYIYPSAINNSASGQPSVINTTENRTLSGVGFSSLLFGYPNVSPRFILPSGIIATRLGSATIQSQPRIDGFDGLVFGVPSIFRNERNIYLQGLYGTSFGEQGIEYRNKTIKANGISAISFGASAIENKAVLVQAAPFNYSSIFGDVSIRNNTSLIAALAIEPSFVSQWHEVFSTKRNISLEGINATSFGDVRSLNRNRLIRFTSGLDSSEIGAPSIKNVALSFTPHSFTGEFGNADISLKVRSISVIGNTTEKLGLPSITKTPQITVSSIDALQIGYHNLELFKRHLLPNGFDLAKVGGAKIDWRVRKINSNGFNDTIFGIGVVTFANRKIGALGSNNESAGVPWVSFYRRQIIVSDIQAPQVSEHTVGYTRVIQARGFEATQWLSRIIPEITQIYPRGFVADIGNQSIENALRYVYANGVKTFSEETLRFGLTELFNKTQYVFVATPMDSELSTQPFGNWFEISNANINMLAFGTATDRHGTALIYNSGRTVMPSSVYDGSIGNNAISHYSRNIRPTGMDSEVFSRWHIVYNAARVIKAESVNASIVGLPAIAKTRRYYERVGNWESESFGLPLIADRVRYLLIDSRYGIAPPYIQLPIVDTLTKYITVYGDDYLKSGLHDFAERHNIITTRWKHTDLVGEPILVNRNRSVIANGNEITEIGEASILNKIRYLYVNSVEAITVDKPVIKDRKIFVTAYGLGEPAISRNHKLTKTAVLPYMPQYINLDELHDGIAYPPMYNSDHGVRGNSLQPPSIENGEVGNHDIHSNGIIMRYGISIDNVPNGVVISGKIRSINVEGIKNTIYVSNGANVNIFAIFQFHSSDSSANGERFGSETSAVNKNRKLSPIGYVTDSYFSNIGSPILFNRVGHIKPKGISSNAFGIAAMPELYKNVSTIGDVHDEFGDAVITRAPYTGTQKIFCSWTVVNKFGDTNIENFNRSISPIAFNSLQTGYSRSDTPYMWQSLRIGAHVPFIVGNIDSAAIGDTAISLRVRNIAAKGFDSFASEYDIDNFTGRMTVRNNKVLDRNVRIAITGHIDSAFGLHAIKNHQYFIRPDGNSETYRQGVGEWM